MKFDSKKLDKMKPFSRQWEDQAERIDCGHASIKFKSREDITLLQDASRRVDEKEKMERRLLRLQQRRF